MHTNPDLIAIEITKNFRSRFISDKNCGFDSDFEFDLIEPIISDEDNEYLISEVLVDEIKNVVFDLVLDKAPRPDDFSPFFFQKY